MGGGLMQLVAYGAQDVYLSGNPQITFFKVVYRRHTNFAVEPIQQTWNGAPDFGRTVTCNINRNGDLITNMYLVIHLNKKSVNTDPTKGAIDPPWGYVNRLGHAIVENVKIEIGGSKIDEHYGDWLNIWYELTHKAGQERGYSKMIGDISDLTNINNVDKPEYYLYVPLIFWFNRNNGLALPLIALQYHDVRITLTYRKALDCVNWRGSTQLINVPSIQDSYLLIDYVYLDSEERKRFAQASHEYLIEQLQFTGAEALQAHGKYRLNFNHPSKYLVWVTHMKKFFTRSQWLSYNDGDWSQALDTFAKLLYIATRKNLIIVFPTVTATDPWRVMVNNESTGIGLEANAAGDLFEGVSDPTISTLITNLLSKFTVKLVAQEDAPTSTITADIANAYSKVLIAAGMISTAVPTSYPTAGAANSIITLAVSTIKTNDDLLSQLLSNVVVTSNNLSMADLSYDISSLNLPSTFTSLFQVNLIDYHNYGNYLDGSDNPTYSAKLQLNGHDRFQARDGYYFNYVQPFQHFSNTPADGINVYSFALKAEDHQPTGSCNFSRIDNATLQVDIGQGNIDTKLPIQEGSLCNIYTMNYNVLRVMSGMAGTAYSN